MSKSESATGISVRRFATMLRMITCRMLGTFGSRLRANGLRLATEWEDYERLYDRISQERRPLTRLQERVGG